MGELIKIQLRDDDFMNACFDDNIEGTELLLRIILNRQDIHVKSVTKQRQMKNLIGRDIWLDIDAIDDLGTEYDIEVQRADKGADRKRARDVRGTSVSRGSEWKRRWRLCVKLWRI